MTFFFPTDECRTDPDTNLRIGPSGPATFALVACGILLAWRSWYDVTAAQRRNKGVNYAVGRMLIECLLFVLYAVYYSRCRAWLGLGLYILATVIVLLLYRVMVPPSSAAPEPPAFPKFPDFPAFPFGGLPDFLRAPTAPRAPTAL